MATLHDNQKGSDTAAGTTLALSATLAVTQNDLVFIGYKHEGAADTPSISDGINSWTPVCAYTRHTNNDLACIGWACIAATSTSINPTITSASRAFRHMLGWSYTPAAGKQIAFSAAASPFNAGNDALPLTNAVAGAVGIAIGLFGMYGARDLTAGSGWAEAANHNLSNNITGEYKFPSGAGSIVADGTFDSSVEYVAHLAFFTETVISPTINTQPRGVSVLDGDVASFTIAATASAGGGSLSYQWKKNGSNAGTNSTGYADLFTRADNGAQITCDATDSNGTTTSSIATVYVRPAIVGQRGHRELTSYDNTVAGWFSSQAAVAGWFDRDLLDAVTGGSASVGAASPTLGNLTLSSAGTLALSAALASTLGNVTLSSAATLAIAGALSKTLGGVTLSSASTLALAAALSKTLGDVTLSSASTLALAGALSKTLGDVTSSSTGTLALVAALASTLGDVTLSSAAAVALAAQSAVTLADATLSSSATLALAGTLAKTLDDLALSSDGVGIVTISGALDAALADLTLAGVGVLPISAAAGITLAGLTLLAGGTVALTGNADITLATLTLVSASTIESAGGASAAQIWAYVLPNGMSAGDALSELHTLVLELHQIHGLEDGSPLVVSSIQRTAAAIVQSVDDVSGTVTVTRH